MSMQTSTAAPLAPRGARTGHIEPVPAGEKRPRAGYSMRRLLVLLVTSTALPLVLLLVFHMVREARSEVERAGQLVKGLAEVTAAATAAALAESERVARYLAERPQVRALDPGQCDAYLEELLKLNRHFVNVATADAEGNTVCSLLRSSSGARPNIANAPWFRQVKAGNGFVVGNPQKGIFTGRWVAPTGYPIRDERGDVAGAAGVVINLSAFEPMVKAALPAGGVAAVVNSEGMVMARSDRPEEYVGRRMRDTPVGRAIFDLKLSEEVNVGAEGVERFFAYQPVGGSGWYALVGVPTENIYAEARRGVWRNGLIGMAILLVSALLVLVIHRKIADPMHVLVGVARRVAEGQLDQRAPESGPREVVEVAAGFNRMLDTIPLIEGELRRSEEQYRTLFDASPDAIRVVQDGRMVMVNPACVRLLGAASRDELIGKSIYDTLHPRHHEAVRERVRGAAEDKRPAPRAEFVMLRLDGSAVDVEVAVQPFIYRGQAAVLTMMRDLTERKAAEHAMRQLNAELETRVRERTAELKRANQSLEAFGYTVAHDLRSPLRSMVGFASLLREDHADKLGQEGADLIGRVVAAGETMDHLIKDLLAIAHLERVELELDRVDLSAMAAMTGEEMRLRDPMRTVAWVVAPGLSAVTDRRLIKNVLDNLMGNALKFTSGVADARIEFGSVPHEGGVAYFVRDNGAGFDPKYVDKLFQTFHRLHTAEEFPGTGIGLASVRRIIEHLRGRVWAEGEVGHGATFYFTLGAAGADKAPQA